MFVVQAESFIHAPPGCPGTACTIIREGPSGATGPAMAPDRIDGTAIDSMFEKMLKLSEKVALQRLDEPRHGFNSPLRAQVDMDGQNGAEPSDLCTTACSGTRAADDFTNQTSSPIS